MDRIVSAISADGSVVCYAIDSSQLVSRAERIHRTSAPVTAALGRLLTGTSLMGLQMLEDDQTVTVQVRGDGPVGGMVTVADSSGNVKGYVGHAVVEIPSNDHGKLDVSGVVGRNGTFQVLRDMGGDSKEPFVGSIPLVSGEIAEDFTSYYAHSEQIPTAMALGVLVNPDLSVANAGGFLAQLLPGATEESIVQLEENIAAIAPVTELYSQGKTPEDIVELVLHGLSPKVLRTQLVEYRCDCSRERVERALISVGATELQSLIDDEETTTVECHFCPKIYRFNKDELRELLSRAQDNGELYGDKAKDTLKDMPSDAPQE